jgi:hypothetical protein
MDGWRYSLLLARHYITTTTRYLYLPPRRTISADNTYVVWQQLVLTLNFWNATYLECDNYLERCDLQHMAQTSVHCLALIVYP